MAELITLTSALAHAGAGAVGNSCIAGKKQNSFLSAASIPTEQNILPVISSPAVSTLGTLTCRGGAWFSFMDLAPGTRGGGEGTKGLQQLVKIYKKILRNEFFFPIKRGKIYSVHWYSTCTWWAESSHQQ